MGVQAGSFDVPIVVREMSPHNNSMKRMRASKNHSSVQESLLKSDQEGLNKPETEVNGQRDTEHSSTSINDA
jgi:hypothetical protein